MNPAATAEFRDNRARFTHSDLQEYADRWVAFSADGRRIVACGETISEVLNHLGEVKIGLPDVVLDHIVFDSDEIYLGGAEFS